MADNKDYWASSQEQGSVRISEDVVASIAALAASEVKGVSSLSSGLGSDIAELLGKKNLSKGVKIQFLGDDVSIDIFILVKYGFVICDVASKVQENVIAAVESMTGLKVSAANIHVTGIYFERELEKQQPKT
ncbi:MAG: Asp23/Gls24 family envelope stress response protein [Clostridiales bacterium]|nr:Asp23/Gls24 family envelope stress response protein [Clostridiales bacterium]